MTDEELASVLETVDDSYPHFVRGMIEFTKGNDDARHKIRRLVYDNPGIITGEVIRAGLVDTGII